ncbi:ceramide-1-phosphate transfer protein [Folsomia candida]|uniref:ceramide-1-phosphate transfer protein n=1 Tax=Folsomia candida TaxID=158441 RepID=UPI000B906D41|nr:ceramide-1-phosphate transfer protein [Folsomia candida]
MGDERQNSTQSDDQADGQSNSSNCAQQEHFDIIQLSQHLNLCVRKKDNEVDLDEYICVFQQLYKFFIMLGSVFGFVGSDVKTKLEILQGYRTGENRTHYETVEKMLQFEKTTDFINKNKESSASRTLLRLHRALNFVSKFLGKVDEIKDSEGTAHVCKEAYTQTLSKFHPWLIQKGALLAMYALPTKKDLISRVCDGRIETSEVRRLLHEVIASTQRVYDYCETAYRDNDLLDLP